MEKQIIIGYEEYLELDRIRKEKNDGLASEFAVLLDVMHTFGTEMFRLSRPSEQTFTMQAIDAYNKHPDSKYRIEFTGDKKEGRVRILKKNIDKIG